MPPPASTTTRSALDGTSLAVEDHALPSPRARVVIVHGYGEHRGRYAELVSRLLAEGFACHLFDLRGHGRSGGVVAHVDRFEDYLDDLALIVQRVRSASVPLLLVGHSLGGLIALMYVRRTDAGVDAVAVSSPYLRPAFRVPAAKKLLAVIASRVAPKMSFPNGLDPRWLSHDERVVAAYANDPLVHRITTLRWFMEVQRAQHDILASAGEIQLPLLMQLGEEDRIADPRRSIEVFERIGSADKTLRPYAGLRHEIFNELAREAVIDELISWLRAHSS